MRHWFSAFSAGGLSVAAASHATIALWPQLIESNLSVATSTDNVTVIEATNGGILSTFSIKNDQQSEVFFDPLIDSIEIVWKFPTELQSSTFDRFFASSSRFDGINAVGIHLRARLRKGIEACGINETMRERMEENVRIILHDVLPSLEIHPQLSKGFLTKSLCDFHTWNSDTLPIDTPHNFTYNFPRTCLSSSFPFPYEGDFTSFYSKTSPEAYDVAGNSDFERALHEAHRNVLTGRNEPKLTLIKLSRGSANSAAIVTEYLGAFIMSPSSTVDACNTTISIGKSLNDALLVMSITRGADNYEFEHSWFQRDGIPVLLAPSTSLVRIQDLKATVAVSLQIAIAGKGFHRRYVMKLEILEPEVCDKVSKNKTIFIRVPISKTAYIDLDEIRRMERFNEFKLISFSKHIEIERPSSVSSQHVVMFQLTMSSTHRLHHEFPIHFRYQAPSDKELYRSAYIIAPDCFLFCHDEEFSGEIKSKASKNEAVLSYFLTWGVMNPATSRSGLSWLPLSAHRPLPVTEVLVPVGYLPFQWLVSSVTLSFATLGAIILIWLSAGEVKWAHSGDGASWKSKLD